MTPPTTSLQLRSLLKPSGELEVCLVREPTPSPRETEVLVRVEASPVNPSDLGLLFGPADLSAASVTGSGEARVLKAPVSAAAMKMLGARVGQSMPVGNEGSGVVVAAGTSAAAQALLGKKVAVLGGAMYAQFRCVRVEACLVLPDALDVKAGAGVFINPLTALGMVETMRREGHTALVHNAAASSLGQMLVRLCQAEGIGLVNIVRKPEQEALLRALGAKHVCNSSAPTFMSDLIEAIAQTGATLAFDPVGGGTAASQILTAMEVVLSRAAKEYSRYGSATHKQVYIYGALDTGPTELKRSFGLSWGVGGWLLTPFLQKVGPEVTQKLKERVVSALTTTFAMEYAKEVSLAELLLPAEVAAYAQRSTAGKYLVTPQKPAQ